jgi:hypothetical protein
MTPEQIQQFKDGGKLMIELAEAVEEQKRTVSEMVNQIERLEARNNKLTEAKIDGQDIEYWHRIATSALQTNDHLISRQRELLAAIKEKERINADLEQQLGAADITPQRRYMVDGAEVSRNDFWNWVRESPEGIIQDCSDEWMHGTSR